MEVNCEARITKAKMWVNIWNRRDLTLMGKVTIIKSLIYSQFSYLANPLGCALFSKFFGLNAVLVELDELSSGVPSFFKSDHGKLFRISILCLVTWVSRGTCVMVS